jgi:hypothetical protein
MTGGDYHAATTSVNADQHSERLTVIQTSLIDLPDFLDPNCLYFQAEIRSGLA